jgi:hypothetical protein
MIAKAKRYKWIVAAGIVAVLGCWEGTSWWRSSNEWPFHRMLPNGAQDVHEWFWHDTLLPDYNYLLKARISLPEFEAYVAHFRLTPHTPSRTYRDSETWFTWRADADWWDPSESKDTSFVRQEGDGWTYAKYEHGHLYLKSLNH